MTAVRGLWLLASGIAIQLVLGPTSTSPPLLALSMGSIILFVFLNRRTPGLRLVLLGMALNVIVMGLNGAMPVSGSPFGEGPQALVVPSDDFRHSHAGPTTRLSFLGDVIPFGGKIFSAGDVLMAAGLACFVLSTIRLARARPGLKI